MTENKQQKLIKKASIYIDKNRFDKAARCLKSAYTENGKFNALIFYFLGMMHEKAGNYVEAMGCLCNAVEFLKNPNNVINKDFEYKIFWYLARSCSTAGLNKNAIDFYEEAYKRCNLPNKYGILMTYLYTMVAANTSPARMLQGLHKADEMLPDGKLEPDEMLPLEPKRNDGKIHIAYISPDFNNHVMSYFYPPLLKYYDKSRFYVTCIYLNKPKDEYTKQAQEMADNFKFCLGMPYSKIAAMLKSMRVDIAVDLAGFTANTGISLFRYRVAPVQISGLGWMESTGMKETDYLITDKFMDEPGHSYITEKPLYVSTCFCYNKKKDFPASAGAPCKKNGYVTFGTMNRITKITDEMLIAWREILNHVPNSKILLNSPSLHGKKVRFFVHDRFKKAGIDPERVILEPSSKDYMLRYLDMDIALDTYPYGGCGTTFEALYMGVPVVSMYGERRSSRFGLSILNNAGIGELAVPTADEYVERAVALAHDWELLDVLHKNLRTMLENSTAMDGRRYAREMEAQYEKILQEAREKEYSEYSQ